MTGCITPATPPGATRTAITGTSAASDDVIKSSRLPHRPFEIESVIMELPYVLECAITGVPDETPPGRS